MIGNLIIDIILRIIFSVYIVQQFLLKDKYLHIVILALIFPRLLYSVIKFYLPTGTLNKSLINWIRAQGPNLPKNLYFLAKLFRRKANKIIN